MLGCEKLRHLRAQPMEERFTAQEASAVRARDRALLRRAEGIANPSTRKLVDEELAGGLLPDQAEHLAVNPKLLRNVRENYLLAPAPRSIASLIFAGADQHTWYHPVANMLFSMFGEDAPRFAALMASFSPRTAVGPNLVQALRTWRAWQQLGRPVDPAQIKRAILAGGHMFPSTVQNNTVRSLTAPSDLLLDYPSILHGEGILSGPKVSPFYGGLLGEVERIVQDTHMAEGFGTSAGGVGTIARGYAMDAALRNSGLVVEHLTGHALPGSDLQAAYWSAIRAMSEGVKGPGVEERTRAALTQGDMFSPGFAGSDIMRVIKETPSFQSMMLSEQAQQILTELGLHVPESANGMKTLLSFEATESLMREGDLMDAAQRRDLVKAGKALFGIAALLLLPQNN